MSRIIHAAIALCIAVVIAGPVSAEIRRQPLREIDVLLALIDADVPPALWPAVDGVAEAYRDRVHEREARWAALPSLDRVFERPADVESRRREQRRRSEEVLNEQRRLVDELRARLLGAMAESGGDPATVDSFVLWLQARAASRSVAEFDGGGVRRMRLPEVALAGVDASARRAIAAAMVPHLKAYIRGAEVVLDAALERAPGQIPTDAERRIPPEFMIPVFGDPKARQQAADDMARLTAPLRRAALAAVPEAQRLALERSFHAQLEGYFYMTQSTTLRRRFASRLPGLDAAQRAALQDADRAVEEFLEVHRRRALEAADADGASAQGRERSDDEPFHVGYRAIEQAWQTQASEVLGDRLGVIMTTIGRTRLDDDEAIRELFGDEIAQELLDTPDPSWQMRLLDDPAQQRRRQHGARWRSLAEARPVSEALRRELAALAGEHDESVARVAAALATHDAAWVSTIEPLQARCRENFERLPKNLEEKVDTARILGDLATLRHAIEATEAELVAGVATVSTDSIAMAAWRLERATELLAPRDRYESTLWSPLLPSPQSVDEVVDRSGAAGHGAEIAKAIAYGLAVDDRAGRDRLVPALRERQDQLERVRIVMVIREVSLRARMGGGAGFGGHDVDVFNAAIEALLKAMGVQVGDAELAVVNAWEEIISDWEVALAEEAEPLRRAWLLGVFPEFEPEAVPVRGVVVRLGRALDVEDPRRALLDAIVAAQHVAREEWIIATAERLAPLPRSMDWILVTDGHLGSRQAIGEAFQRGDSDLAARTLRQAIAVVGVDVALATPAVPAALARLEAGRGF